MYSPFGSLESSVEVALEVNSIVLPSSITFRLSLLEEVTLLRSIEPSFDVIVNTAPSSSTSPVMSVLLIVTFITSSFIVAELVTVPSSDTVNSTTSLLIV